MTQQKKVAILAGIGLVAVLCLTGWFGYTMRDSTAKPTAQSDGKPAPAQTPVQQTIDYALPSTDPAAADPTSWAMAAAISRGRIYFGTDKDGIWCHNPTDADDAPAWTQVDTASGLAENAITAMATDSLGRVWVGHVSQGLSIFNGQQWSHYDPIRGPLSGHVYDIKTCPTDGDVWVATVAGLSRYRQQAGQWQYFTATDGLPSNQIRTIAFAADGTAYVGAYCQGIAIARPTDNYQHWTTVHAPSRRRMPRAESGPGLPSEVINSILVARNGTVYVATAGGLGISKDSGTTWTFLRGRDWSELVKGLKASSAHDEDQPDAGAGESAPLAEDWCCALAEDGAGRIWVGHRRKGNSVLDPATGQVRICATGSGGGGVRSLVPIPGSADVLVATYGPDQRGAGGFRFAHVDSAATSFYTPAPPPAAVPPLPNDAGGPPLQEIQSLTKHIESLPTATTAAGGARGAGGWLGEDWATRGDWVGRYGQSFADIVGGPRSGSPTFNLSYQTGPHNKPGGTQTWHYVAASTGDNPYWLWSPMVASRCIGEINDGGWNMNLYPTTWDGPDLWITFSIPKGIHRVTPIFIGGSSHEGHFRDYVVDLIPLTGIQAEDDLTPPLASARVTDYWHTLYSQFVITQPGRYALKVSRSQSHMAGINGLMIDRLDAPPGNANRSPYPKYTPPAYTDADLKGKDDASTARIAAAVALWQALDGAYDREGNFPLQKPGRLLAYRAALAAGAGQPLLDNWRWKLCLWTEAARTAFQQAMTPPKPETPAGESVTFP